MERSRREAELSARHEREREKEREREREADRNAVSEKIPIIPYTHKQTKKKNSQKKCHLTHVLFAFREHLAPPMRVA